MDGDTQFAADQLADMTRLWDEWDYTFDSNAGLYYFTPNFDAQEYSLPGFVVAPSGNDQLQLDGPNTYRPSHNVSADLLHIIRLLLLSSKFDDNSC